MFQVAIVSFVEHEWEKGSSCYTAAGTSLINCTSGCAGNKVMEWSSVEPMRLLKNIKSNYELMTQNKALNIL